MSPHAIVTFICTPHKIVICSSFLSCPGHMGLEVITVSHSAKESLKCSYYYRRESKMLLKIQGKSCCAVRVYKSLLWVFKEKQR